MSMNKDTAIQTNFEQE